MSLQYHCLTTIVKIRFMTKLISSKCLGFSMGHRDYGPRYTTIRQGCHLNWFQISLKQTPAR